MQKTVIIYASRHGTTEKIARRIAEKMGDGVSLVALKQSKYPDIQPFETVILGTSIYTGEPRKVMTAFCKKNENSLLEKTVGLFVCGMHPDSEVRKTETAHAYPDALYKHAKTVRFLGGEFLFDRLNFFEKLIVKKVSKATSTVSAIDKDEVAMFTAEMQTYAK